MIRIPIIYVTFDFCFFLEFQFQSNIGQFCQGINVIEKAVKFTICSVEDSNPIKLKFTLGIYGGNKILDENLLKTIAGVPAVPGDDLHPRRELPARLRQRVPGPPAGRQRQGKSF